MISAKYLCLFPSTPMALFLWVIIFLILELKYFSIISFRVGAKIFYARKEFCTDNGVMIAWNGVEKWRKNADLIPWNRVFDVDVQPRVPFGQNRIQDVIDAHIPNRKINFDDLWFIRLLRSIEFLNRKVSFIYNVSTCIAQNLILWTIFSQVFFVKTREFIFQNYILTKVSCCILSYTSQVL